MEHPQSFFTKHPNNPIFGDEKIGTLFDIYVTPQADGLLRMDLSWRTNNTTAVSFSEDGVRWDTLHSTLSPEPKSGWEDLVNRNCVLKIGNTFKMWYTGQANGRSYIGYAESDDGLHFRRVQTEPVLVPETPWENLSVMNPCVLFENGRYRMWYSAGETFEPNVLCYAESCNGLHWEKSPLNPILTNAPQNIYERERIGGCQILPHKELGYLLFYIGYRDIHTACICCACSRDGVTGFRRCRHNPLILPTPGAWYNGRNGGVDYIGLAEKQGDFTDEDFD